MRRDVAVIILYNDEGKILLQHRDEDAERMPGYRAFFGGGIDEGESPEEAVKREAKEELEYDLEHPELIMVQESVIVQELKSTKNVFVEKFNPSKKIVQHEGQGMARVGFDELDTLKIIDHDMEVLKYIKEKI